MSRIIISAKKGSKAFVGIAADFKAAKQALIDDFDEWLNVNSPDSETYDSIFALIEAEGIDAYLIELGYSILIESFGQA